ncbi:hypothetical protein BC937DRAFT_87267 [Endogone sp. FLAS-F59071]|nr:hypothetical protein BC937DRAFT_87267 [Endogone sp. FLAS-F59071]|eukprot:RUS12677.1 hypothetical protein BC937DRAFT_87267 [Endogone sp. FLAS-F59071]
MPEFMAAPTDSPLLRYLAALSYPAFILSVTNSQHSSIVWANKTFLALIQSEFINHGVLEEFVCQEAIVAGWLDAVSRHDSSKDLLVTFWTRSKGEDECIDVDCTAVRVVDTGIVVTGRVLENTRRIARLGSLNIGLDAEEGSAEILEQNAQTQAANLNQQSSAHLPIPPQPSLYEDEKIARIKEYLSGGGVTGKIILGYDWASTALGPMTTWPQSLLTCLSVALTSTFPMFLWWGPKLITFYRVIRRDDWRTKLCSPFLNMPSHHAFVILTSNDGYIPIAGGKHPKLIGMEGQIAWVEIWDVIGPMLNGVLNGVATWSEDKLLIMQRFNFREEAYFTVSDGVGGAVAGDDARRCGVISPVVK